MRRFVVLALALAGLLSTASAAQADPALDLENLSGAQLEQMLQSGQVTSVQLVRAYEGRIAALNKAGPGLNAVTQINPDALKEAAATDYARAHGKNLGPAMGLPILLKDIIDATPMYTSAGDWALRNSYPAIDSGVAKELRAHGVVVLGKLGLSEWANSFGSQPSGFSNLTGQVLNANDAAQGPSGSSSGSGTAGDAGLAALTIGTETSGSIIGPSTSQSLVGLRPTVGLVPGYGIAPIDVSQDTAGPMVRTVTDSAMTLQSIAEYPGSNPLANQEYLDLMGPNYLGPDIPAPPTAWNATLPDYSSALDLNFVRGKRIGFNNTTCTPEPCTPTAQQQANAAAVAALQAAGAILVPDATTTVATLAPLPSGWEAHATIDEYYKGLGPNAPVKSLAQEVAVDATNPQEALKDGNSSHLSESQSDDSTITNPFAPTALGLTNHNQFRTNMVLRKRAYHSAVDAMMQCPGAGVTIYHTTTDGLADGFTTCPDGTVNPVIAIIGSAPSTPQAGYPEMVVPMGYTTTQRRNIGVDVFAGPYGERDIIGVGYVIEQATKLRKPVGEINPSAYRCARTQIPEPYAARGHCNPDYQSVMSMLGGTKTILPFPLEMTSAQALQAKLGDGSLTSTQLVKAELTRIALANAQGPAVQAVRAINPKVLDEAAASDARRAAGTARGPLEGIPVLVDDTMSVTGLATSAGTLALQDNLPAADSALVAKLKAAGAVILGDTNTGELGGVVDANMPQSYSALGGQVLLPADTNKNIGGSSGGSAGAVSVGFAPLAVGMETGTDAAQLIAPAGNAGVVGLKPTVGLVSHDGVLPVATSQDAAGPIGQTVFDVASALSALTGTNYTSGLSTGALTGKTIGVIANTTVPYPDVVTKLGTLATTKVVTPGAATTAPSIVPFELQRDLAPLKSVVDYNTAHPVEGLKFGQSSLTAAVAATDASAYATNLAKGVSDSKAVLDAALAGTSALLVPSGSAVVGIADRAGYPVLTLPGGYAAQNSNAGGDPLGVVLIGAAGSEAELLADGYALEQAMKVRDTGPGYMTGPAQFGPVSGAPSMTNQSMWRCVEGSAFFHPYACNAGEVLNQYFNGPNATAVDGDVGGTVPATLALTLGAPASFGPFTPGVEKDYTTSTTANVISTAGDATLSVSDPGHLANGAFELPSPLQVTFSKSVWSAPVSNDAVTVGFKQHIGSTDALRTGTYSKTLTFTLSTTTP